MDLQIGILTPGATMDPCKKTKASMLTFETDLDQTFPKVCSRTGYRRRGSWPDQQCVFLCGDEQKKLSIPKFRNCWEQYINRWSKWALASGLSGEKARRKSGNRPTTRRQFPKSHQDKILPEPSFNHKTTGEAELVPWRYRLAYDINVQSAWWDFEMWKCRGEGDGDDFLFTSVSEPLILKGLIDFAGFEKWQTWRYVKNITEKIMGHSCEVQLVLGNARLAGSGRVFKKSFIKHYWWGFGSVKSTEGEAAWPGEGKETELIFSYQ